MMDLTKKSSDNYMVAHDMMRSSYLNAAANRFYYSVFQIAYTYFTKRGKVFDITRVHSDIMTAICCMDNPEARKANSKYGILLKYRKKADYEAIDIDKYDIQDILEGSDWLRSFFAILDKSGKKQ